jgi:sugar lactone lactonase YvrE
MGFAMRSTTLTSSVFLGLLFARLGVAQMQYPLAVTASESGPIYVADRNLPGVWKMEDGKPTLYFEGSKRYRTPLYAVRCLAFDKTGSLLAGDTATREVYRFDKDAKPVPLTNGGIGMPMSIAVNSKGELLVADLELHRIWRVPAEGGKPEVVVEVQAPRGVCVDSEDQLWIVSHSENQVVRWTSAGKREVVVAGRPFEFPHHIVLGPDKTAFLTDGYAKAVWKISPGGTPVKLVSGEPLLNPVGLAWRGENLLVADPKANAVFEITTAGKVTRISP